MAENPPSEPQPVLRGKFSVYETPDGGYHIAYITDGQEDTNHLQIPGSALRMAAKLSGSKNPLAAFSAMMKGHR